MMNNHNSIRVGQVLSPATQQDLTEFLRLDLDDCENLQIYLDTATSAVISYLGLALLDQDFTFAIDGYPYSGTPTTGLANSAVRYQNWIDLPYSNITTDLLINTIDEYGNETLVDAEDYVLDTLSIPNRVRFINLAFLSEEGRLKFTYKTGYGNDSEDVPNAIRLGILQVAGYLYEHRGECTPAEAVSASGAGMALQPFKVMTKL
jgi:uncharacterized phiE125 gp8 family phage protein